VKEIKPKLREMLRKLVRERLETEKTLDTRSLEKLAVATRALILRNRLDLAIELLVVVAEIELERQLAVESLAGKE